MLYYFVRLVTQLNVFIVVNSFYFILCHSKKWNSNISIWNIVTLWKEIRMLIFHSLSVNFLSLVGNDVNMLTTCQKETALLTKFLTWNVCFEHIAFFSKILQSYFSKNIEINSYKRHECVSKMSQSTNATKNWNIEENIVVSVIFFRSKVSWLEKKNEISLK